MSFLAKFKKNQTLTASNTSDEIGLAMQHGIQAFFSAQHEKVPSFVRTHFRYPGCWKTNRCAFGLDLFKAPINLLWAPLYVCILAILMCVSFCGHKKAAKWANQLPGGMTTKVQRTVNTHVRETLLDTNALKQSILSSLAEHNALAKKTPANRTVFISELDTIVDDTLKQLMLTRTASADIANTLFTTAAGALAFNKFTPGGFGIGLLLAVYWATENAKQNFILGPTIGSWYYSLFPPEVSWIARGAGVLIAMLVLALIASFSGLVTDPIQSVLRLHHRRLHKMLNELERGLINKGNSQFRPLDPYIARILELFDSLKSIQ